MAFAALPTLPGGPRPRAHGGYIGALIIGLGNLVASCTMHRCSKEPDGIIGILR